MKVLRLYFWFAAVLLLVASAGKIVSSFGEAKILQYPDAILSIPFRYLLLFVSALEIIVAIICIFGKNVALQSGLVAWLATSFLVYRLGVWESGYHIPCSCLGNITDALHISPKAAGTVIKIILAYLLIGSYVTLFWLWRQRRLLAGSSEMGVGGGEKKSPQTP